MNPPAKSILILAGLDKSRVLEALLEDGEDVIGLVIPDRANTDARLGGMPALAAARSVPVHRVKHRGLRELLNRLQPDILLSLGYPSLLGPELLGIAGWNLNVHPTLLPKYRGPATAWHVLAAGEKRSGVTVHHIDAGMDTGPVLAQLECDLGPFDTLRSLKRKTDALEPPAVRAALVRLRSGDPGGDPQNEAEASTFRESRTPDDSRVDPSRSLLELYDFIRACDPDRFPAFFEVEGQRVGIRLFRPVKPPREEDLL
ncbi:MAG: formyltransferase family protein [Kiritimatiellia bacterium]